jgi:hypothetical protein
MIKEANRIQSLGREVRKAEGAGLEFMGYQRTSGPGILGESTGFIQRDRESSEWRGDDSTPFYNPNGVRNQPTNMSSREFEGGNPTRGNSMTWSSNGYVGNQQRDNYPTDNYETGGGGNEMYNYPSSKTNNSTRSSGGGNTPTHNTPKSNNNSTRVSTTPPQPTRSK